MRAIAIAGVAFVLALVTGSSHLRVPDKPFAFEVQVSSTTAGRVQLYYDIGHGLSEADSVSAHLESSGDARTLVRLPLPEGVYRAFRFDPIDAPGAVSFADARIVTQSGTVVRTVPSAAFAPNDQVDSYRSSASGISFHVPDGRNDPNLAVTFAPPLELHFSWRQRLTLAARAAVAWFFVWLATLAAIALAWSRRAGLARWAWRNPHPAIWSAATVAAAIACYPVVFCGKSFVSPNINALLRATPPTIPGYADLTRTDLHAADDSAVLWQNVPYSVVQHDALFRDHELPLWNRFVSCGVTLLGQGQSMLGDPIHLLVVAADGASWAWDAKFVIARAVFAAGVGVTVWALTADLMAALIAVVAAAFVAFFNFRFNHPAVFSFAYSAWILAAWALIVRAHAARRLVTALLIWVLANVSLIGSGTAKEAYMLLAVLNGCGIAWWATLPSPANLSRLRRNAAIGVTLLCGMAISMPLWLPFFGALRQQTNVYVKPTVWQAPRAWLIGLFDDLFYVETNPSHRGFLPAANVLVLLGVLFAALQPRRGASADDSRLKANATMRPARTAAPERAGALVAILALAATGAILLAHEFVPARWIAATPVLRNIYHIHNTFDAVAVVLLTVIAGCGLHAARRTLLGASLRLWTAGALVIVGGLLAIYFHDLRQIWMTGAGVRGWIAGIPEHAFFFGNLVAMLASCVVLVVVARRSLQRGATGLGSVILVVLALAVVLYRHGLHVDAVWGSDYLSVPMPRASLAARSPGIERIQADHAGAPFRVVGTDLTLIGGWNAMYRLEGLNGADAIMNPDYRDLLVTAGLIPPADWRLQLSPDRIDPAAPLLDFLGVRYVVSERELSTAHYTKIATADVTVYRSERTWPRAFFTDRIATYAATADLLSLVQTAHTPFAAIERTAAERASADVASFVHDTTTADGVAIAASDFRLTANSTTFRVRAPSPGIAVLHETWLPDDFRATLDGVRVPYFRVNGAFKGIVVPSAGVHTIRFVYWPRHLTLALWMALAGVAGLGLTVWRLVSGCGVSSQICGRMPQPP